MRSILLPVERDPAAVASLETAALLARSFDSYVEGFALAPDLPLMAPADAFSGTMVTTDPAFHLSEQDRESCHRIFEEHMKSRGLAPAGDSVADAAARGACFGWFPGDVVTDRAFFGAYGRIFDVTVVARPESGTDGPRMAALETALFESGRPVLIAPPKAPAEAFGQNILIAWNGTPEIARTVAFAQPLLHRAKRVAVVSIEGGQAPVPSGEQLAWHLRRYGIACEVREVPAPSDGRGAAFLAEAARLGSDLVIKGAYTQSRLRQMIFGGATRHIVTEATLPVFMAH
jgi:nucleotide-binding universal stress UspA family protein